MLRSKFAIARGAARSGSPRWLLLVVALLAFALIAAACGEDDGGSTAADQDEQTVQPTPAEDQGDDEAPALAGRIEVDGSSTVFPITEAMAEEFQIANRGVQVTVGISGSGGGFKRFCAGETDISDASRPIKPVDEVAELCEPGGIEFIEIPVAFDGLTVVVNPKNDFVDFLTVEELNHIFRPADPALNWSQVRDGFPDEEIVVFAPGADSGTFDYFTETINGESGAHRSENSTFSEDDNVLVIGVAGEEGAIGYFGYSYYVNNTDRLKAVPVINPDTGEATLPSLETISSGTYAPLSRPLFIYVKVASLAKPEVAAFVNYYLTEGRPLIDSPEVGYVQLPDELYALGLERLANRTTGSAMAEAPDGASLLEIYQ